MITVVSGLPRSGTSMLMRMLHAGGMSIMTDSERPPDVDNIHGYFEYAPALRLDKDSGWLDLAEGKAVKIISPLLFRLPPDRQYSVILMQRPLAEILASQNAILERKTNKPAEYPPHVVINAFRNHLDKVVVWMKQQPNIRLLCCEYHQLLRNPDPVIRDILLFLNAGLDALMMRRIIEPRLCHYCL